MNRRDKILTAVSLICRPEEFQKFEEFFLAEYYGLGEDIFEFVVRGMGDHPTTITDLRTDDFDVRCQCGIEFKGVTLRTLWKPWSEHVHAANLAALTRKAGRA